MKDTQLYLVIGILVSIDLIAMTAWQIFDPFYRETKELAPYVSTQNYRNMLSQTLPLNHHLEINDSTRTILLLLSGT